MCRLFDIDALIPIFIVLLIQLLLLFFLYDQSVSHTYLATTESLSPINYCVFHYYFVLQLFSINISA